MPGLTKLTTAFVACGSSMTSAGPLIFCHNTLSVPYGSPSSFTTPRSPVVACGRYTIWSGPAYTVGE